MKRIAAVVLVWSGAIILAQAPKPKEPPTLTDSQKAAFWKATSELQKAYADQERAAAVSQQKQAAYQAMTEMINKACGADYTPNLDTQGDPTCIAKPKK